ncbi:putative glycolipid-binding domain-containing protein [Chelativorans salis]|uniref:Glycolipid-binding domain-containing protein n=1 Tax=Chelativorans salis TaxID=2978478 RepID=A0ABT2LS00_9HYPH|nr:putative glycolipid-binding domain-containing protein [Chelativorans sp. EGI FJ00035]MCT7377303.1 putative glycolipid-binding domain-containing protein [Chelativorans sp. EGI FJ00035]
MIRKWRRLDEAGLEVFQIAPDAEGFRATSTIVHAGAEAFGMSYIWLLDQGWRTRQLDLRLSSPTLREMRIQRAPDGWLVDGRKEPDLVDCEEVDLSATPFCNSLAIRLLKGPGALTALYVDLPSLQLLPSRQRYEVLGDKRWRYVDLGVAEGFEANLTVDQDDLVIDYEGLFKAVE